MVPLLNDDQRALYDALLARFGSPVALMLNMSEREMNDLDDDVFMAFCVQIKSPSRKTACRKDRTRYDI